MLCLIGIKTLDLFFSLFMNEMLLTWKTFTCVMNPVATLWTLNHLCVWLVVIIALMADGAEMTWCKHRPWISHIIHLLCHIFEQWLSTSLGNPSEHYWTCWVNLWLSLWSLYLMTHVFTELLQTWLAFRTHCCLSEVLPFLCRTVQSGQRSSSWFHAKSQVFPGVTPQLLHRMQVMHTYTNTTMSQNSKQEAL